MSEAEFYYTLEKKGTAEFKDRGSRFIAYAFPIASTDDFKTCLEDVKKEHPKASHHCFAYRLGTDGNNFRSSDDGEPSGTAGKPILGQIDSKELTGVLVVVSRYFGGTLLGAPGLINAYKTAASLVLQVIPAVQKFVEIHYRVQFDYTQINEIMIVVKKYNCRVIEQSMNLFCSMHIGIPRPRLTEVIYSLNEIRNIEIQPIRKP